MRLKRVSNCSSVWLIRIMLLLFSFSSSSVLAQYCIPDSSNCELSDVIANVRITTLTDSVIFNNASQCGNDGYSDYTSDTTVDTIHLNINSVYKISLFVGNGGLQRAGFWIDYNHNDTFDLSEYTSLGSGILTNLNGQIHIPRNALLGETRMRCRNRFSQMISAGEPCTTFLYGETEDYSIFIENPYICDSMTDAGNVIASEDSVCPSSSFQLSTSLSFNPYLLYRWQQSYDSVFYYDIQNSDTSFIQTQTDSSRWYRLIVSCSGRSDTSLPARIIVKSISSCNSVPVIRYCDSGDAITQIQLDIIDNSSACSAAGYSDYTTDTTIPSARLMKGDTVLIRVKVDSGFLKYTGCWIDYNQNGLFESSEFDSLGTSSNGFIISTLSIPFTANNGFTKMRISCRRQNQLDSQCLSNVNRFGETEDYRVTLLPCPMARVIQQPENQQKVCGDSTLFFVTDNGQSQSYHWQYRKQNTLNWIDLQNNAVYEGVYTTRLIIKKTADSMNGNKYRLILSTCDSQVISNEATLMISKITITAQPSDVQICEGEVTSISIVQDAGAWFPYQGLYMDPSFANPYDGRVIQQLYASPVVSQDYSVVSYRSGCTSDTVHISVEVRKKPLVSIKASPYVNLFPGIHTTIYPLVQVVDDSIWQYQWNWNGINLPGQVDSFLSVPYYATGIYSLFVTDKNGCKSNESNRIVISDSFSNQIFVYPNPTNGLLQVCYANKYMGVSNPRALSVFDENGRKVYQKKFYVNNVFGRVEVDLRGFPKGIYFIDLKDAAEEVLGSAKVIIQ